MTDSKPEQFAVYSPRTQRQVTLKQLAARPESLNGKTIAQLWDFRFRGDEVFELLEEGLKEKYPEIRFVSWRQFGNTHGPEGHELVASLPQRFSELGVDAVISCMGC